MMLLPEKEPLLKLVSADLCGGAGSLKPTIDISWWKTNAEEELGITLAVISAPQAISRAPLLTGSANKICGVDVLL